jgi:hypothetical protein
MGSTPSRCGESRQERLDHRHHSIGGRQASSVVESGELVELDPQGSRRAPVLVGLIFAAGVHEAGHGDPAEVDVVREQPSTGERCSEGSGSFTRSWYRRVASA